MTEQPRPPIQQVDSWPTNAELIADVARLGYLRREWRTLDPTWGYGTFWNVWRPDDLWASDLTPPKSPVGEPVDFRRLPWPAGFFDCVVFDPPYKLNGRPTDDVDERYGVHVPADWPERMALIEEGIAECARVLGNGYLLLKCQDQVCRNKVRWQTVEFTIHARSLGLGLVDRFDRLGGRPQPSGRPQRHARHNVSTLLVFQRGWETRAVEREADPALFSDDEQLGSYCDDHGFESEEERCPSNV